MRDIAVEMYAVSFEVDPACGSTVQTSSLRRQELRVKRHAQISGLSDSSESLIVAKWLVFK